MQQSGRIAGRGIYWSVLLIFVVLFVGRLLGVYNIYFLEEDEISLAAGIAGLVRDNVGDLYRYTPQLGYHRIVEWMTLATGGDVSRVPWLMKLWSVTVGALVPALGLLLFRDQLSTLERWLLVLSLAANPILWRSSQYGNSAMGSLGFAVLAMVFLSNRGGPGTRALGLAFAGTAIFVRADAVLLIPMFAYLLFRQLGSWRPTLAWLGGFAVVGALTAAIIYAADTRLDDGAAAVAAHMNVRNRTQFWEYLLWAMSPIPLLFAALGARVLADTRPALLGAVVLGCLGPMLFYFRATTTPRYFLLATVPVATAVAVGMSDVAGYLRERWGGRLAWAAVLAAGCLHVFVGMGQFPADRLRAIVDDAKIPTHDGPMPTGSLLYQTYLSEGFLGQSFGNSGFGGVEADNWEAHTYPLVFEELKRRRTPQNVIFLLASGWDHVFHFYAQAEHADYLSRQPSNPSWPFSSETWIKVGPVSVMTIGYGGDDYKALPRFDMEEGDEVWITGSLEFPDDEARMKVPADLTLTATDSFDPRIRIFRGETHVD